MILWAGWERSVFVAFVTIFAILCDEIKFKFATRNREEKLIFIVM
jgi:hypothetical protein